MEDGANGSMHLMTSTLIFYKVRIRISFRYSKIAALDHEEGKQLYDSLLQRAVEGNEPLTEQHLEKMVDERVAAKREKESMISTTMLETGGRRTKYHDLH